MLGFQLLRHELSVAVVVSLLLCWLATPVGADVRLNELLASNTFTNVDEEGDAEDWVELVNTGSQPVDLTGYSLSDDPEFPMKWVFPEVTIPPRGHLLVWISGKNRFVPPPEVIQGGAGDFAFDPVFVEAEDEWRYLVADIAGVGPPAGWNTPEFDDSSWTVGRSGFGYGDEDDFTELAIDTNAVFTRRAVDIPDPAALSNLVLQVNYDDGFVAYLNGVRVASGFAPAEDPTFASEATGKHEAGQPERFDLTPYLGSLRPGRNVLAVVGLNEIPSSDMSLVPELGIVPLVLHTNFRLNRDGEVLILSDASGQLLDDLQYPEQTEDHSYGRSPDGTGGWFYFLTPTPLAPNTSQPYNEPLADRVTFNPAPGVFSGAAFDVTMAAGLSGVTTVRYTTDGSVPTSGSTAFSGPIAVTRSTSFRAAGFVDGERATRVVSASYFLNVSHRLPIMSITMEPEEYVFVHNTSGARGRSSEREGFMEYFEDGSRVVASGFGLRLHGGAGRGGDFNIKKAYKAYFRGSYGATKLRYPIIPETPVDEFDKLVLRSGFNDSFRTSGRAAYVRDEVFRDLHEDMGALAGHGSWCILYVNQRMRGVYNIVERLDEDFLSSYFEGEDWDVIKTGNDVLVGSIDEWNALRNFIVNNDMSQPVLFDQALDLIDIDNFTSYMLVNIWGQNHDWPHNNWYAARERVDGARWMFLSWDAEFGIGLNPGGYSSDTFEHVFGRGGYHREILENLLANTDYREYFIQELDRHLFESLRQPNVATRISALSNVIRADMPIETALHGRTTTDWETNVSDMLTFSSNRNSIIFNFVQNSQRFAFAPVSTPRVVSASPSRYTAIEPRDVILTGIRLTSETRFEVNGVPVPSTFQSAIRAVITMPLDAGTLGRVTVTAMNPGTGESSDAVGVIDVLPPVPDPQEVIPAVGRASGGEMIVVNGRNFVDGIDVLFGDVPATSVRLLEDRIAFGLQQLEVVTPPGAGSVELRLVNNRPLRLPAEETLTFTYENDALLFLRGDVNRDATVDLSDAQSILGFLFLGAAAPGCEAAADANGSNEVDVSDAVAILGYLFQGAEVLPAPYPDCGESETNTLSCENPSCAPSP